MHPVFKPQKARSTLITLVKFSLIQLPMSHVNEQNHLTRIEKDEKKGHSAVCTLVDIFFQQKKLERKKNKNESFYEEHSNYLNK